MFQSSKMLKFSAQHLRIISFFKLLVTFRTFLTLGEKYETRLVVVGLRQPKIWENNSLQGETGASTMSARRATLVTLRSAIGRSSA